MSATNRPLWSGLPVKVIGSIAILAFLAFLMVPQNRIDDDDSVGDQNTEVADDVDEQSECSRELARIVNGMQPGRLGIVSDATDLAAELNRWFAKCGSEIDEDLTQDVETQRKLVSPEIFAVLQTERFLPEDIAYVRQCLLAKAVAAQVCANLTDDTQRVLALFQFLSRQLVAVDSQETAAPVLPASPYETLLWGQGSAADRAWAFATLLQQLRIDAMVIVPRQQPEHWLLGVNLVDQGILLFDPHLGLPIPGNEDAADTPYPTAVASLTEVLQDDGPFRKLDLPDHPYPLQKNDLENLSIHLIGSPSQWSDRMARLQYMVAPIEAVDPLPAGRCRWSTARVLSAEGRGGASVRSERHSRNRKRVGSSAAGFISTTSRAGMADAGILSATHTLALVPQAPEPGPGSRYHASVVWH